MYTWLLPIKYTVAYMLGSTPGSRVNSKPEWPETMKTPHSQVMSVWLHDITASSCNYSDTFCLYCYCPSSSSSSSYSSLVFLAILPLLLLIFCLVSAFKTGNWALDVLKDFENTARVNNDYPHCKRITVGFEQRSARRQASVSHPLLCCPLPSSPLLLLPLSLFSPPSLASFIATTLVLQQSAPDVLTYHCK